MNTDSPSTAYDLPGIPLCTAGCGLPAVQWTTRDGVLYARCEAHKSDPGLPWNRDCEGREGRGPCVGYQTCQRCGRDMAEPKSWQPTPIPDVEEIAKAAGEPSVTQNPDPRDTSPVDANPRETTAGVLSLVEELHNSVAIPALSRWVNQGKGVGAIVTGDEVLSRIWPTLQAGIYALAQQVKDREPVYQLAEAHRAARVEAEKERDEVRSAHIDSRRNFDQVREKLEAELHQLRTDHATAIRHIGETFIVENARTHAEQIRRLETKMHNQRVALQQYQGSISNLKARIASLAESRREAITYADSLTASASRIREEAMEQCALRADKLATIYGNQATSQRKMGLSTSCELERKATCDILAQDIRAAVRDENWQAPPLTPAPSPPAESPDLTRKPFTITIDPARGAIDDAIDKLQQAKAFL